MVQAVGRHIDRRCVHKGGIARDGCRVSLSGAPQERIIVDFDRRGSPLTSGETRCDYLFVAAERGELAWVVPIELKKGALDLVEASRQLQAGARVAEQVVPRGKMVRFRPVVAFGGGLRAAERKRAKQRRRGEIRFRGYTFRVELMKCGEVLMQTLCR